MNVPLVVRLMHATHSVEMLPFILLTKEVRLLFQSEELTAIDTAMQITTFEMKYLI